MTKSTTRRNRGKATTSGGVLKGVDEKECEHGQQHQRNLPVDAQHVTDLQRVRPSREPDSISFYLEMPKSLVTAE